MYPELPCYYPISFLRGISRYTNMATPPPLHGREIDWPPPSRPDAAHEWVADVDREIVVEVNGQPYLLTPLVKRYTDPLGLRELIPPDPIIDPPCPLCRNIIVSQSHVNEICSLEGQIPCKFSYTHLVPCSVTKDPNVWRICRRSAMRRRRCWRD